MRVRAWLLSWILVAVPVLPAMTLKQLLVEQQIPADSFTASELNQTVGGTILLGGADVVELAYDVLGSDSTFVSAHVVKYDKKSGVLQRSKLQSDKTDVCLGSFTGMLMAGDFTLVSAHISPSAECTLVLDSRLAQKTTLYGFEPTLIAPNQVVLIENMIHFSPVHPERLQLADLKLGTTTELYPPAKDAMRAKLANENAMHMPAREICIEMNDPCDPHLFDEEILGVATGSGSRFALIVKQSASHATVREEHPTAIASQSALYIYAPVDTGWIYCEVEISNEEATMRTQASRMRSWQFNDTAGRCIPSLPVVPDLSTAEMNPFLRRTK